MVATTEPEPEAVTSPVSAVMVPPVLVDVSTPPESVRPEPTVMTSTFPVPAVERPSSEFVAMVCILASVTTFG